MCLSRIPPTPHEHLPPQSLKVEAYPSAVHASLLLLCCPRPALSVGSRNTKTPHTVPYTPYASPTSEFEPLSPQGSNSNGTAIGALSTYGPGRPPSSPAPQGQGLTRPKPGASKTSRSGCRAVNRRGLRSQHRHLCRPCRAASKQGRFRAWKRFSLGLAGTGWSFVYRAS